MWAQVQVVERRAEPGRSARHQSSGSAAADRSTRRGSRARRASSRGPPRHRRGLRPRRRSRSGSKSLAERYSLGVSPATVRNDMAALEDEGYIAQPHTSAGRVPTDLGYRLFVDRLSTVKPLSVAERRAIESFLEGAVDLDDVVRRSVRLLAQITRQVAVVQYPTLSRSAVRHVEVVAMTPSRLLLVLITDKGRVEQRVVEMPRRPSPTTTSPTCAGCSARRCTASGSSTSRPRWPSCPSRCRRSCARHIVRAGHRRPRGARRAAGGTGRAGRHRQPHRRRAAPASTSRSALRPVLEALEEQVVLLRLLGHADEADTVTVRIGHENDVEGLQSASVDFRRLRLRRHGRPRPDPHGLPGDDGGCPGGGALRGRPAGQFVSRTRYRKPVLGTRHP